MRALPLAILALLVAAPAVASGLDAAPLTIRYQPSTGALDVGGILDPEERKFEADTCSTAGPVVASCDGALGVHPVVHRPDAWMTAQLYPREIAAPEGGYFDMWVQWETAISGIHCTFRPAASDPGALLSVACDDVGDIASYDWLPETWTFHGAQSDFVGGIQYTIVFDGGI